MNSPNSAILVTIALIFAFSLPSAALSGIVWDGSGSPSDAGFEAWNTGHDDVFSFDTPVVGMMTQVGNTGAPNWRHYGAELSHPAGWFVESRLQLLANNDKSNGEGAAIFLRNTVGSIMLSFRADGAVGVWNGETTVQVSAAGYGGVDGLFHDVRMQTDAGGSGYIELLVDGESLGLVEMLGRTDDYPFVAFGDINSSGEASVLWDHVVNNDTVPSPTVMTVGTVYTWSDDVSGNWTAPGNWAKDGTGSVPNSTEHTAIFGSAIQSAQTIFTNEPVTVQSIEFDNTNQHVIAGIGPVIIQADSGDGSITVKQTANQGSPQFQVPVSLGSTTNVDGGSSSVDFNNQINTNGNALNLTGVVNLNHSVTGGGAVSGSGTLGTASNTSLGGDLTSTGTLAIEIRGTGEGSGSVPTDFSRFDVSGAANLGGAVDISLVDFTPTAGTNFTILTTTNGINFVGGSTGIGDLNLTGDSTDFSLALGNGGNDLVLSYLASGGVEGDFNGNGTVDAADYTLWRDSLGTNNPLQNDPVGGQVSEAQYLIWKNNFGSSLPGNGGSSSAAVPEPATLTLFLLAALTGIVRTRCR